ncbi:cyclin-D3-1-like [Punica granatum]|uniref:Uncharacterized protein n=2 Tax=Punica granatum TaxID=22663 RepID=A0A218WFJ9_PUNGR|nr:cyclin-D3-1-like [Punica granatum]OWM70842.1 hypothetical protein CDL15_Pgr014515 [Punica granatum]PKI69694.1 hypothetical protein CRG98_009850 [Punica granatum]
MAHQYEQDPEPNNPHPAFLFDALYCSEQHWELHPEQDQDQEECFSSSSDDYFGDPPLTPLEQDLFWDDEELVSLSSKEAKNPLRESLAADPGLEVARAEAAEWILAAQAHHGFSAPTAVLAVNYLDRFLCSFRLETDKPWMTQLTAVACLSLAAKVEETQVPLLLDLQVEETRFVFEAKTIQRMELLVLSALEWKMNPVTPISFLDYFARRLRLKDNLCWEFLRRSELILLSLISDCRSMSYLPSVMATAVMLHVVNSVDLCLGVEDQSQLLDILDIEKDKVDACRKLVSEHALRIRQSRKRKFGSGSAPGSPNTVLEMCFSPESSNDSWAVMESESKKRRAEAEA